MAASRAANLVEKAVGHGDNASITTDVSNYQNEHGMGTGEKILATTWQGKKSIKLGMLTIICSKVSYRISLV
jgi:hypothetical protein